MKKLDHSKVDTLVVHAADTYSNMDIGYKEIKEWHTAPKPAGNGWSDIGYHFIIRRDGETETGRSIEFMGAHAYPHNDHTLGVCLAGGKNRDGSHEDNFTLEQKDALERLYNGLRKQFPGLKLKGHGDYKEVRKPCPCFYVEAYCEERGFEYAYD